jgi:acyl-[acyl-carrier-protein]-phospholipid O-acyltransferase/long-chain-fatty-acid--[acyl-carrier-protein] ligase
MTGYGATETAPLLSVNTPMHHKTGTVGRFVPGIEWRLEPVAGLARGGRLWVKGPNVMLGYLLPERPGVLVPPEGGWYDTGDIVEVDGEGFVTIVGRAKRFAKLGGEMVSLAAVEELAAALRPEAGHAAVALPDPRKGERIVLVTTDRALDRAMLLEAARRRGRPELMVPAEVVPVAELPRLGSGKTDYPAVQRLAAAASSPDAAEPARIAAG